MEIKNVAVVGMGVIGASWAANFLAQGLNVVANDANQDLAADVEQLIASYLSSLGIKDVADLMANRYHFEADLGAAVANADFIQENGPERLPIKHDIIKTIESTAASDALIVSSSSGLLVSDMQQNAQHPERIVLGHPFNPPHLIPLVEVIGGKQTSASAISRTMDFYTAIGKKPVHIKKEVKGHVVNRLQAALFREAFYLIDEGVISVADLDAAVAHGPGLRWAFLGPCMNLHLSGGRGGMAHLLEHLGPAFTEWWADMHDVTLDDALKQKLIDGMDDQVTGIDQTELIKKRDAMMHALIKEKNAQEFDL